QHFAAGSTPYAVVIADVNADGAADLVTPNLVSSDVSVLAGKGDGTFAPAQHFAAAAQPASAAVADLNGDGAPDLVVVSHSTSDPGVILGYLLPKVTDAAIRISGGTATG